MIWLTGAIAFFGLCSVVAAFLQWSAMNGQLNEMKSGGADTHTLAAAAKEAADTASDSFKLERQRAEESDEAICLIRQDIALGDNLLTVTIVDGGRVSAHKVQAHVEVSRNRLPDNKQIALLAKFDAYADELRVQGPPIIHETILSMIDWRQLYGLHEAIVISGTVKYENGFDDWRSNDFCQAFVVEPASQASTLNGRPVPVGIMPDCARLPETLKHFAELKK